MGIGISVVLMALGAILIWGTNASVNGLELTTIGIILLGVGAAGALLSIAFWASWGGGEARRSRDERVIVDRR